MTINQLDTLNEKTTHQQGVDCLLTEVNKFQKQPFRVVHMKKCSENMQQIYRRAPWRGVISVKLHAT